ncbi:MAG: hypothetical protein DMG16_28725 [Acidobacteria bacterium]|nr:MAG: hypothetical protein DMG16_28725 [Acidobacteriota bacterium]
MPSRNVTPFYPRYIAKGRAMGRPELVITAAFGRAVGMISPSNEEGSIDMADPQDLQEAADAIRTVRALPAVQRHQELDEPLRLAEEWARREYRKVREENGDHGGGNLRNDPRR